MERNVESLAELGERTATGWVSMAFLEVSGAINYWEEMLSSDDPRDAISGEMKVKETLKEYREIRDDVRKDYGLSTRDYDSSVMRCVGKVRGRIPGLDLLVEGLQ